MAGEKLLATYTYKVERSSGKIIGYVKHAKPDCRDWGYDYYVTDNDELYYMESVLSYDAKKCGTSVYKVTFGNDFESIRIQLKKYFFIFINSRGYEVSGRYLNKHFRQRKASTM